jgi:hypothetical protein
MGLTIVSGLLLVLWGAPVNYPGILRWDELGRRLYGPSYQIAFIAKMGAVFIAAVATLVWARRRHRDAVVITVGATVAAVAVVTAMSQFHLFSHL